YLIGHVHRRHKADDVRVCERGHLRAGRMNGKRCQENSNSHRQHVLHSSIPDAQVRSGPSTTVWRFSRRWAYTEWGRLPPFAALALPASTSVRVDRLRQPSRDRWWDRRWLVG